MEFEIGKKIKKLRMQKGTTQEELAGYLGISCQAVSKWENGATAPDIQLLPAISAFFGITIDALFEFSEETRLERLSNMAEEELLSEETFKREESFLLELIARKPQYATAYGVLADLYANRARGLRREASTYAKKALELEPDGRGYYQTLNEAENAGNADFYTECHFELICYYKDFLKRHPENRITWALYMDQLMAAGRFTEAKEVLDKLKTFDEHPENIYYEGDIAFGCGDKEKAEKLWDEGIALNSEDWRTYFLRAERYQKCGEYEKAIEYYKLSFEHKNRPRMIDELIAIAQLYEILGQKDEAVKYYEKEIEILEQDFNITSGVLVEEPTKNIMRIKSTK